MYYLANGLKTDVLEKEPPFYVQGFENNTGGTARFAFPQDEIFYELDNGCVSLHDYFLEKIFPDVDEYYRLLPSSPIWASAAGHDSDFTIEKEPQYINLENNKFRVTLESIEKPKKIVMYLYDEDQQWSKRFEKNI